MTIPKVGDFVRSDYGVQEIEGIVVAVEPFEDEVGQNAEVTVAWFGGLSTEYAQDVRVAAEEPEQVLRLARKPRKPEGLVS